METGSFDGARRARLMRERVWAGYGVVGRPVYIGVLIHICMFMHGEREDRCQERRAAASHHEYEWGRATESRAKPPSRNRTGPDSRGASVEDEGFQCGRGPLTVTGP